MQTTNNPERAVSSVMSGVGVDTVLGTALLRHETPNERKCDPSTVTFLSVCFPAVLIATRKGNRCCDIQTVRHTHFIVACFALIWSSSGQ